MLENERVKIINFLQDFGCARLKHLQIIYDKPDDNFNDILSDNFVSRKDDIFVHNTKRIDMKMIYALDVLCKYKTRYKHFYKNYDPTYISFLTKENVLYNIIVTDKENEKGVLKLLRLNSPIIPEADKMLLLFQDKECLNEVEISTPFAYCTYPNLKIVNRK